MDYWLITFSDGRQEKAALNPGTGQSGDGEIIKTEFIDELARLRAALAEACKVIEPFGKALSELRPEFAHSKDIRGCGPDLKISPKHLRAARAFLEANKVNLTTEVE